MQKERQCRIRKQTKVGAESHGEANQRRGRVAWGKQNQSRAESEVEANKRTRDEEPGAMEEKTNVMRMIEQKLPYKSHYCGDTDAISAKT